MRRPGACAAALTVSLGLAVCAAASAGAAPPRVPPGCALGIGGPALRAATTVAEARDAALAALAAERLPLQLTSEVGWSGARLHERSGERVHGLLRGARIVGLRGRSSGRVDALACGPEIAPSSVARLEPDWRAAWPRAWPRRAGCALGVAGRDLHPELRARSARRDALEMLAREQEAVVEHALSLEGGRRVARSHSVRASDRARIAVARLDAGLVEQRWVDERGDGPLRLPGVLYLRLCLPDAGA